MSFSTLQALGVAGQWIQTNVREPISHGNLLHHSPAASLYSLVTQVRALSV
jgi:hypothetical protein